LIAQTTSQASTEGGVIKNVRRLTDVTFSFITCFGNIEFTDSLQPCHTFSDNTRLLLSRATH